MIIVKVKIISIIKLQLFLIVNGSHTTLPSASGLPGWPLRENLSWQFIVSAVDNVSGMDDYTKYISAGGMGTTVGCRRDLIQY